jgi:hypothetical protein
VSTIVQCFHDRLKLPIGCVVVLLSTRAGSRSEVDWLEDPEFVELIVNAGKYEATGIGLQNDGLLPVVMLEDRSICKGLL